MRQKTLAKPVVLHRRKCFFRESFFQGHAIIIVYFVAFGLCSQPNQKLGDHFFKLCFHKKCTFAGAIQVKKHLFPYLA